MDLDGLKFHPGVASRIPRSLIQVESDSSEPNEPPSQDAPGTRPTCNDPPPGRPVALDDHPRAARPDGGSRICTTREDTGADVRTHTNVMTRTSTAAGVTLPTRVTTRERNATLAAHLPQATATDVDGTGRHVMRRTSSAAAYVLAESTTVTTRRALYAAAHLRNSKTTAAEHRTNIPMTQHEHGERPEPTTHLGNPTDAS